MSTRFLVTLTAATLALAAPIASAQNFGAGNLVVYRVGAGGATTLVNTGSPVFLDEYTPAGALVRSVALPATANGAQRQCIASGTASSEGFITRSVDGQFLIATCYGRDVGGTGTITGTTSIDVPRVIARIGVDASVDSSTALTDAHSTNNIRSAASLDGTAFWSVGGTSGVRYSTLGATTSSQVSATGAGTISNFRQLSVFGGQLYVSTASGTAVRLATVGSGTPTTTDQTITHLPGIPVTNASPYAYVFFDLDAGVAGVDTLYVADDSATSPAPAITKFSLVGGSWVSNGSVGATNDSYRGLAGSVSGGTVTLWATRRGGTAAAGGGELVSVSDASGYNGAFTGTPSLLITAATNTAFRGVALAPVSAAPTPPSGVGSATPATIPNDGTTTSALRVVVTPGTNPVSTGITVTANLTALGGSATQALVDNGTGCDTTAGDLNFCVNTTAPPATTPGPYSITFAITDAQARNGGGSIALTVVDATPPDSTLSIAAATVTVGLLGTQTVNVPVTINPPRPVDVAFTATTGGGTASPGPTPPDDYIALAAQSVTIPANTGSFSVPVTIHPRLRPASSKTFTVTIASSAPNVVLGTAVATVTIDNNAAASTPIPAIQGSGDVSPLAGQTLTSVDNIVTATVANGFVMQARAPGDGNPATSDAMFVFTGSAPAVAVGDVVDVRGRVGDFASTGGGRSLNATQFFNTTPALTVVKLGTADVAATTQALTLDDVIPSPNPNVPACVALGGSFAPTADPRSRNFGCLEYMRVATTTGVITAPNQRFGSDLLAEMGFATSGRRAFREPGVSFNVAIEDPVLANLVPTAPALPVGFVFDGNPEVFEFDPDRLGLPNAAIVPGSILTARGVVGVDFADYEFWPNQFQVTLAAAALPRPVPTPAADQFKVASYNLLNLFDRCDDPARPNSNETFNVADTNRKLEKHSRYIREVLAEPGIIAVQEVELPSPQATVCANAGGTTTSALQLLADRIAADGGQTYLVANSPSTNDPRFISVGFLYRQDLFLANIALTQVAPAETWTFRYVDGNAATQERSGTVHDRPPLRMEATAPLAGGGEQRFALVVNHFRSLSGIDDLRDTRESGATLADPTFRQDAHRVRQKRLRQAISMACSVQAWQSSPANAGVPLILLGDHNAFEFSDGYADLNALLIGNASPATAQYVGSYWPPAELPCAAQAGGQFVAPGLENAVIGLPAVERYSFNFQFNAQALDHALLNGPAQARFEGVVYGRGNSDAPVNDEFDATTARRSSDHDALVLYLNLSSTRPSTSGFGIFKDGLEAP
jgi:predicted extracellular nuclease